jgi:hypothetical protein
MEEWGVPEVPWDSAEVTDDLPDKKSDGQISDDGFSSQVASNAHRNSDFQGGSTGSHRNGMGLSKKAMKRKLRQELPQLPTGEWDDTPAVHTETTVSIYNGPVVTDVPFETVVYNELIDVKIMEVLSVNEYTFRLAHKWNTFEKFQNELTEYYDHNDNLSLDSSAVVPGRYCILKGSIARRVFIEQVMEDDEVQMYLIDYAKYTKAPRRRLHQLEERFSREPISAFRILTDHKKNHFVEECWH